MARDGQALAEEGTGAQAQALSGELFARLRQELPDRPNPLSTYRLQLNHQQGFEHARARVPYLERLGVTDLYLSPILRAAPGSQHGYDVVDHSSVNPELGTPGEHEAFFRTLRERGLGLLLDVVPNHMGIERGNAHWLDVLENGPASLQARFFDIDWHPVKAELVNKVLLPVLGDQFGVVLERGELRLGYEGGGLWVHYYEHAWPVAPGAYPMVLEHGLEALEASLGQEHPELVELQSILTALHHLPPETEQDPDRRVERNREKEVVKRRLGALTESSAPVRAHLEAAVTAFNGQVGDPRSFDALEGLLARCSYRLAHWRVAGEEINYRRFFDINSLAAIRVQDPVVFEQAHALVFQWLGEGSVTGLRIDHPDGLFDPTAYLLDLQQRFFLEKGRRAYLRLEGASEPGWPEVERALRDRWVAEIAGDPDAALRKALYVVVEKIQGGRERIPDLWAVHGTTGYRFANGVTGLFVDRQNEKAITELYTRFIGRSLDFHALVHEKKRLVLSMSMASEINVLARELNRISELNRRSRDFTLNSLRRALVEFVAQFPVYRTYVDGGPEVDDRDAEYIRWTIRRAKQQDPVTSASLFDFLEDVLLRRYPEHVGEEERAVLLRFAMRLQQVTGSVMAKGLEDTAFYIYNRLTSLNEVGGEPERFGTSPSIFHLRNQERAEKWPSAMLTSSTHDAKRSEDVRARISVLSELPAPWRRAVRRWARMNDRLRTPLAELLAPDPNEEYAFYQALLGAWPTGEVDEAGWRQFRTRMREYVHKAIREAKVNTSWLNPEPAYEEAMLSFVDRALDWDESRAFLRDAQKLKRRVERPGQLNSLAQLALKLASPGAADFYQGSELWDLSLVDPDNRRPVDFPLRQRLLEELDRDAETDREALCLRLFGGELTSGAAKLYLTTQGLRLRRRRPALFRSGGYAALDLAGPRADHAVAFCREGGEEAVVAIVPRLLTHLLDADGRLGHAYAKTTVGLPGQLAGRAFRDILTGREHRGAELDLGELFELCPVALLEACDER